MSLDYYISVADDDRPVLQETLTQPDGTVINLTGYTVTCKFVHQATGTVLSKSASNTPGASGIVQFTFAAHDFEDVDGNALGGGWDYQLKAVASGVLVHVPNDGYKTLWATLNVEAQTGFLYYPQAADEWRFLEEAGLTMTTALKSALKRCAAGGRRNFEKALGGLQMLAGVSDTTEYFSPPTASVDGRPILFLSEGGGTGALAVPAASAAVVYQPLNSSAETLVEGTDYIWEPRNARTRSEPIPYTRITFLRRRWSAPLSSSLQSSLLITGRWGAYTALPEDAFNAMLALGAMQIWGGAMFARFGGLVSWTQAQAGENYGVAPGKAIMDQWELQVQQAVSAYRVWSL